MSERKRQKHKSLENQKTKIVRKNESCSCSLSIRRQLNIIVSFYFLVFSNRLQYYYQYTILEMGMGRKPFHGPVLRTKFSGQVRVQFSPCCSERKRFIYWSQMSRAPGSNTYERRGSYLLQIWMGRPLFHNTVLPRCSSWAGATASASAEVSISKRFGWREPLSPTRALS